MCSVLSTSPEKSTNSEVVQLSINTSSVCCPHHLKRVPLHATPYDVYRIFFPFACRHLLFFHFFFPLPFIIAACSALIIDFVAGADTRLSHLFRRWWWHSMLPFISSVVPTLPLPPSI